MSFEPLIRIKLADQIAQQLSAAIGNGSYAPGQALPSERELAQTFGASRVAVREALVSLQAQGLIERAHGRSARVLAFAADTRPLLRLPDAPTEADVRDVKQTRLLVEVEAARIAAVCCAATDADRLRAALEANRKAIGDRDAFLATDMALHGLIASICKNSIYVGISRELFGWLARFQTEAVHVEGSVMLSHREHARIVDRIIERDPDGAATAMLEHLSRTHLAYGRLHSLQTAEYSLTASRRAD